jgi:hypothetical protein
MHASVAKTESMPDDVGDQFLERELGMIERAGAHAFGFEKRTQGSLTGFELGGVVVQLESQAAFRHTSTRSRGADQRRDG